MRRGLVLASCALASCQAERPVDRVSAKLPGAAAPLAGAEAPSIERHYVDGERVAYRMHGLVSDRTKTKSYDATATGLVKRSDDGHFFEEFQWSDLVVDGTPVELPESSRNFRERVTLDPQARQTPPDLHGLHPALIAPVFDLMTFYVDLQLALRVKTLRRVGDRADVPFGRVSSWTNPEAGILLGEDCFDFRLRLMRLDRDAESGTLAVRHVPSERSSVRFDAEWLKAPVVASAPNNWVEILRGDDGRFVASVGSESFDVELAFDARSGRITHATLANPVEVLERRCSDRELAHCDDAVRYRLMRQISIDELATERR